MNKTDSFRNISVLMELNLIHRFIVELLHNIFAKTAVAHAMKNKLSLD